MSLLRVKELEAQLARRDELIKLLEYQLNACEAQNSILQELIANHTSVQEGMLTRSGALLFHANKH